MNNWYVVYTKPRLEAVAVDNLQRQGFGVFFPRARQKKRKAGGMQLVVEPLFPRYLFVQLQAGVHDFAKLRSTKGCIDLVRFGGKATPVPSDLITLIASQLDDESVMNLDARAPALAEGQEVRVEAGPFEGLVGRVAALKSADRVLLLLNVLGAERPVEIHTDNLGK